MTTKPHFITDPRDPNGWDFRQDCMAWHMFTTMAEAERAEFIRSRKQLQTPEFTQRLRRCLAWWMLVHMTRPQIVGHLMALQPEESQALRDTLNIMQAEIKAHRQREFKTAKGATAHE